MCSPKGMIQDVLYTLTFYEIATCTLEPTEK